jgi:hypothetical protein
MVCFVGEGVEGGGCACRIFFFFFFFLYYYYVYKTHVVLLGQRLCPRGHAR